MNFSFTNLLVGLALSALGVALIKYSNKMNDMLYFSWKSLGERGYKYLGLLLILLSAFVMFGILDMSGGVTDEIDTPSASTILSFLMV